MDVLNEANTTEIQCPAAEYDEDYIKYLNDFERKFYFWIDGVALCSISIPGLLLNLTGIIIILKHPAMHNVFNYLLIGLFFFDSLYILVTMLNQSFMKQFNMVTRFSILIYPHLMHPLKQISFTISIFMTTTLAYERHLAIKDPIGHRIKMGSAKARRVKLITYILVAVIASVIFNFPKFMEADINFVEFER